MLACPRFPGDPGGIAGRRDAILSWVGLRATNFGIRLENAPTQHRSIHFLTDSRGVRTNKARLQNVQIPPKKCSFRYCFGEFGISKN